MVPERKENSFCFGFVERVAGKGRAAAKGPGGDQHNGGARGRGASHGSRGCKTSIRVRASTASAAATAAAHQSTTTATTLNSQPASHQQQQKPKPSTNEQTNSQPTTQANTFSIFFPLAAWLQPPNPNPCPPHLQHLPTTVCHPNYLRLALQLIFCTPCFFPFPVPAFMLRF